MSQRLNIKAGITFIVKQKEKPVYESSALTGMIPKLFFNTETKIVKIINGRNALNYDIDYNGFELHNFISKYNAENISKNLEGYKLEIKLFLKKRFNYEQIFVFDTTRRSNDKRGAFNKDGRRQPAERAHVDYTEKSGPLRAKDIIGKELYKRLLATKKRIIQINLWKPLSKVVLSSPLAIADPNTINPADLVATDQKFPNRVGEIYHLAYNKNQKWYWIPNMKDNEVLLLKGWDSSNKRNIVKFTPHTSFNIENQDIINNPRDSIEARIFMVLRE